jgi:hypothetical protein
MIKIYHRPTDKLDLKAMTQGHGSLVLNLIRGALPLSLAAGGITYLVSRSMLFAAAIAGALFIASAVSNIRFFRDVKRREALMQDANAVEVFEVSTSLVLDIEHLGSHGPAYCIFGGSGKSLLLVGQWLLESETFPNDSFRLHRWSDSKKPIRIETLGKPLEPVHSTVCLRPEYRYDDIELLDATAETLQADLDRQLMGRTQPD